MFNVNIFTLRYAGLTEGFLNREVLAVKKYSSESSSKLLYPLLIVLVHDI